MHVTIPKNLLQRLGSLTRQLAAVVGLILTIGNQASWPGGLRAIVGSFSALLLVVEHYIADPSTGTTPPEPPANG